MDNLNLDSVLTYQESVRYFYETFHCCLQWTFAVQKALWLDKELKIHVKESDKLQRQPILQAI